MNNQQYPNNKNQLMEWAFKFYHFCVQLGSMVWYFDVSSSYIITLTLKCFK